MNRPEQKLQIAVASLLDVYERQGLLTYAHVPNGGARTKVEGGILKAMGVRAGFPDLIIMWMPRDSNLPRTGFIEMKAGDGRLSESQRFWRDWMIGAGFDWAEARSLEEVQALLKKWGII